MRIREIILALIDRCQPVKPVNRTVLQKKMYFLSKILPGKLRDEKAYLSSICEERFGFKPHYFGPYSRIVASELEELVGIGFIDCSIKTYGQDEKGFEVKRFDYSLTESGKKYVQYLEEKEEFHKVFENIDELEKRFSGFEKQEKLSIDYNLISVAAKCYYILQPQGKLNQQTFKEEAEKLGWKIRNTTAPKAFKLLESIGLAKYDENQSQPPQSQ